VFDIVVDDDFELRVMGIDDTAVSIKYDPREDPQGDTARNHPIDPERIGDRFWHARLHDADEKTEGNKASDHPHCCE